MRYYSLNNKEHFTSFEDAVLRGLAPDKGLYFPEVIPRLGKEVLANLSELNKEEIAFEAIREFVGEEIPREVLRDIISDTLSFDFPVVQVEEKVSVLELFHGPTLAFKDVGAKFMAGILGYFVKKRKLGKVTVLVATSGDTGGAVANGFLGVEGIEVVILYPKGKVSEIQEKQLTTLGRNITALEVNGSFDTCQDFVKKAFLDPDISRKRRLTSANSINVARWLPQMFYYFLAYQKLEPKEYTVFSVPSGNFGNICAGLVATKMGLPIDHFVAANNANDVVTRYFKTQRYEPGTSIQTLSNAMDVGNPSNFVRVQQLFGNEFKELEKHVSSFSFSDEETTSAMKDVFERTEYVLDPHGAVGYLGLKRFLEEQPEYQGVFLETAHPVKFIDTVERTLEREVTLPPQIQALKEKQKISLEISTYEELKEYLME